MIGPIIVSIVATSLIAVYMLIVNHFLRQDEHYHSQDEIPENKPTEHPVSRSTTHVHA